MSGGGGVSIIAAWAAVRNFMRGGRKDSQDPERARLDAEELREVEYESMGMQVPPPVASPRTGPLGRILRRRG